MEVPAAGSELVSDRRFHNTTFSHDLIPLVLQLSAYSSMEVLTLVTVGLRSRVRRWKE